MANDFLVFGGSDAANVIDQVTYNALSTRLEGFRAGVAQSNEFNKVWRQSSIMAAVLAQFICDLTGEDAIDDGSTADLLANLKMATTGRLINVQRFASSGNYIATAGTTSVVVEVVGGGGGGGGCQATASSQVAVSGGGGGGGYALSRLTSGFSGTTVTIGAGGAGGVAGASSGSQGALRLSERSVSRPVASAAWVAKPIPSQPIRFRTAVQVDLAAVATC